MLGASHQKDSGKFYAVLFGVIMVSDLFQILDVAYSHDIRLWQAWIALAGTKLYFEKRLVIPKGILPLLIVVLIHSSIIILLTKSFSYFMITQIILVSLSLVIIYSALRTGSVRDIAFVYTVCAKIIACTIVLEQLINIVSPELANATIYRLINKWEAGPGILVRAHGIMMEPSQVSLVICPALYVTLMKSDHKATLFLMVAGILTFSGLTYVGILVAFSVFIYISRGFNLKRIGLLIFLSMCAIIFVKPINDRVIAAISLPSLALSEVQIDAQMLHQKLGGSVGSVAVAGMVAWRGFQSNAMLGMGIGNMSLGGDSLIQKYFKNSESYMDQTSLFIKVDTGGSLIVRILAELGIVGVLILIYGVFLTMGSVYKLRQMYIRDRTWRFDSRFHSLGLAVVVILTYAIRKDGYLNVYLLLPFAILMLTSFELEKIFPLKKKIGIVSRISRKLTKEGATRENRSSVTAK